MKLFEAIYKDKTGKEATLTIGRKDINNRLEAYNYICKYKLGLGLGEMVEIREKTDWGNSLNN